MADELTADAALARFAARTCWADLPAEVRHEAKRALVNAFATALAGCRDPGVLAAAAVFERFRSGSDCSVIGHRATTDALHAASLNAMRINVFDFDDTHVPTVIHPTAPVAPALFALAQSRRPVAGRDLLAAFAIGVEVACRIGNAVSPWHYQRGWHITSSCGIFGAAAAAGKLLGLDAQGIGRALGNASAQASGLVETLGTMAKSIGVGNAAANGLLSALLAAEGFGGPDQPLTGARGFLAVMGERADASALVGGLGEHWELMKNTYKPYPCGVVLNPVIEACLDLHRDGVRLADVEAVELTGHPLLRERTDRPAPRNGRESQVNARHAVAVALAHGRASLPEFSDAGVADPALGGHRFALAFRDDPAMGVESATVRLRLRGGAERCRHVQAARGSLAVPLGDADLDGKLRTLAAWGGSGCDADALLAALWRLDEGDDAAAVMDFAAAPR